nr:MAG TPA: hypothetical protein [Caudoviricetes sp.]
MDQIEKVHNTRLFMTYPLAFARGLFFYAKKFILPIAYYIVA